RTGAHGDTDIGLGQCRCVVDTITRHGDDAPFLLQAADNIQLGSGGNLSVDVVDTQLPRHRPCGFLAIPGCHDDPYALATPLFDGRSCGFLDGIGHGQHTGQSTIDPQVDDAGTLLP